MIFSMVTSHAPDFFCPGSWYACLFVCLCVYVSTLQAINHVREMKSNSQSNKFLYMTLAIDTIDGWALVTSVS